MCVALYLQRFSQFLHARVERQGTAHARNTGIANFQTSDRLVPSAMHVLTVHALQLGIVRSDSNLEKGCSECGCYV